MTNSSQLRFIVSVLQSALLLALLAVPGWSAPPLNLPAFAAAKKAAQAGDAAAVTTLIRQNGGPKGLLAAVSLGTAANHAQYALVKRLVALGVPVDAADSFGSNGLKMAAVNGDSRMVAVLLQAGAKVDLMVPTHDNRIQAVPALTEAAFNGHLEVMRQLIAAGANPLANNNSAAEMASIENQIPALELLVQKGCPLPSEHWLARKWREDPESRSAPLPVPAPPTLQELGLAELLPAAPVPAAGSPPAAHPRCRLALIGDEASQDALSLLAPLLAADPMLELVERQDLDRLLEEKKLTRQFAAEAAHFAEVGAWLKADALLIVQKKKVLDTSVVESRFVRVNPGLVLETLYRPAPLADAPKWAREMAPRVPALAARTLNAQAIALSLLSIRSTLGGAANREREQAARLLLAQAFSRNPQFVLLERESMERLTAEHSSAAEPFWSGRYLLDGTLEPALDGKGTIRLTVRLQPAAGAGAPVVAEASGPSQDLARLVEKIAAEMAAKLNLKPVPAPHDLTAEARFYADEAQWAFRAGVPVLASSCSETAWALGGHTLEVARLRVLSLVDRMERRHALMRSRLDMPLTSREGRDLLNSPTRTNDDPTPSEWLAIALQEVELWRDVLESDLTRDPAALESWLQSGKQMALGGRLGLVLLDTGADYLRHREQIEALREALEQSLAAGTRRAEELPPGAGQVNAWAILRAEASQVLDRDPVRLAAVWGDLASLHFATDDLLTRGKIRGLIATRHQEASVLAKVYQGMRAPWLEPAYWMLLQTLRQSPEVDDRFWVARADYRSGEPPTEAGERHAFEAGGELARLTAGDPKTFAFYQEALDSLAHSAKQLDPRHPLAEVEMSSHLQRFQRSPELLALRRQLVILVLRESSDPTGAINWMNDDAEGYTSGEREEVQDAARAWLDRSERERPSADERFFRQFLHKFVSPTVDASTPVSSSPTLSVAASWVPQQVVPRLGYRFRLSGCTWAENRLWTFGCDRANDSWLGYVFAVDPLTWETETLALPKTASTKIPDGGNVVVTAESVYLLASQAFLGIYHRATKQWEILPEITPTGAVPIVLGSRMYFTVKDETSTDLLSFDFRTQQAEILVSPRRKPAAGPLDEPAWRVTDLAVTAAGELQVMALTEAGMVVTKYWSPSRAAWLDRPEPPIPMASWHPPRRATGFAEVGRVLLMPSTAIGSQQVSLRLRPQDPPAAAIPMELLDPEFYRYPGLRET